MQRLHLNVVLPCVILLSTSGCIDKNYDLSNIDTTTEVKVTDLTVPVNLDAITLDDVISVNKGDQINKVKDANGNEFYAFTDDGTFKSNPIFIDRVTAAAPTLQPTHSVIYANTASIARAKASTSDVSISYDITSMPNECNFNATGIDKAIVRLSSAKTDAMTFSITLEAKNVTSIAKEITFENVKFQLFKGMTATSANGSYDAKTGVWSIDKYTTSSSTATFSITTTAIDFDANNAVFDADAHTFELPGEVSVLSGKMTLTPKTSIDVTTVPNQLDFEARYTLGNLAITAFSGRICYQLDGLNISPIDLKNIPRFLNEDGTNLVLANPQIYLNVTNPVANDKLQCRTGLTLTAQRPSLPSVPDFSYSADEPIVIGYDHGVDGPYNFVLAPNPTASDLTILDEIYEPNLTPIKFAGLKNILAVPAEYGEGELPEHITIELTNPEIPESDVTDFALGRNLDGVNGSYMFVAPIALSSGSQIIYSHTEDGWNDEDIDAITISTITVSADVTNTTPLTAELSAYPIDINGNRIEGLTITAAEVDGGAVDEPVTISIQGKITHLDGITCTAKLGTNSEDVLTPQQKITLKNLHVKVSGSYIKEL